MKVKFGKLFGWIVLDIFVVGVVEDFNLLSFLLESITYNFTDFSFLGLIAGVVGIVSSIWLFLMAVCFIILSWQQLKSCFQKRADDK
ncbi:hypothetical protein [uncultured Streptococcus sp.]|uniref:hypothetical protein n=1 Tax=uncultured Streptococcus sp. TaxID=83427 RepID=UPI002595A36E|nr:hypothetical protein [uncultured Streptococcus sp.]